MTGKKALGTDCLTDKKRLVPLRLEASTRSYCEEVADLAGTDVNTVMGVMIAQEVIRLRPAQPARKKKATKK